MHIFVSYSRRDKARIDPLDRRLKELGHTTWADTNLDGGQAWWDEILDSIRKADAVLVALSKTSLDSVACRRERAYAQSLGKPLLPVWVAAVQAHLLPRDLAALQVVDYSTPGEDAAIQLVRALLRMPAAPALPDPLPQPPDRPVSYLSELTQQVSAQSLSLDEERSLVVSLDDALRRSRLQPDSEDEVAALLDLLSTLEQRSDLHAEIARRIADVKVAAASTGGAGQAPTSTVVRTKIPTWILALIVALGVIVIIGALLIYIGSTVP
jgi:hypothetical protein